MLVVPYAQVADAGADLSATVEAAYGPNGLGVLAVRGVPGYPALRAALLPLASRLAGLSASSLAALEDPASHFSFGWSLGQEKLERNRPGALAAARLAQCAMLQSAT